MASQPAQGQQPEQDARILPPQLRPRPMWLTLLALTLPLMVWSVATYFVGQPMDHPFILMIFPVLFSALWGGRLVGLVASLLAAVLAIDLATPSAPLDLRGADLADLLGALTLLTIGAVITVIQNRLIQSEAKFREAFASAAIGCAMTDGQGTLISVNDAMCTILGRNEQDLLGRNLAEFPHPDDLPAQMAQLKQLFAGEVKAIRIENRYLRPDGSSVWVRKSVSVVRDELGAVRMAINLSEDISERKAAEAALALAQEQLALSSRARAAEELLASIAHEVNQPMAAIVSQAAAATRWLRHAPPDLDEARSSLLAIEQQAQRTAEVISKLRLAARRAPIPAQAIDLRQLMQDVARLVAEELHRANAQLLTRFDDQLPLVWADSLGLQQVLVNLISNAAQALAGAAGSERSILVYAAPSSDPGWVLVGVRDSGPGIQAELAHRVFEPFVTTRPSGLGLGLWICRSIIEGHGGNLWLEPASQTGAELRFTLPVREGNA